MSTVRLVLAAIMLASTLSAARAADVTGSDEEKARSKVLKDRAAAALDRGDLTEARGLFQQAYDIYPSPNLQFNLGVVLGRLGDDAHAAEAFTRFVEDSGDKPADAATYARAQLDRINAVLGRVYVATDAPSAEVLLDQKLVDRTPLHRVLWGAPGVHWLELHRGDQVLARRSVKLAAGRLVEQRLDAERGGPTGGDATSATITGEAPVRPLVRRPWFWAAVVGGVVVAATAISLGVVFGSAERNPQPTIGRANGN